MFFRLINLHFMADLKNIIDLKPGFVQFDILSDIDFENFVVLAYSGAGFLLGMGILSLVITIIQWRPSREEKLLLKLADQLEPPGKAGEKT